ncbi:hypothetical protein HWV62_16944 [Athelia sp. TMB]|nr:hypothetical protein HWV62_16944 [Athelia sp. TMB]
MPTGVALVTGSAQGIGRAISLRLAEDGFDVAVNDISKNQQVLEALAEEIKAKGRKSCVVCADVAKEAEVKEMVAKVVEDLGGLDVMVANAGICFMTGSIMETTEKDLDSHLDVNLKGVFFCYKYAAIQMIAQGRGGRILGASSAAGQIVRNADVGMSKKRGLEVGTVASKIVARSALGYEGKPEDVASLVSYLSSKEAHFITGQTVAPNGGLQFT